MDSSFIKIALDQYNKTHKVDLKANTGNKINRLETQEQKEKSERKQKLSDYYVNMRNREKFISELKSN